MFDLLRIKITGHAGFKPKGEDEAVITGIFWDDSKNRPAVSLLYKNGDVDWLPLSEIGVSCRIINVFK